MEISNKNNGLFKSFLVLITLLSISLLQACGGGGSDDPVTTVTAVGYYTGGANVKADDDTADLIIDDLQGIFDGKKFKFVSVANDLLYDGVVTSQSGQSYTASVTIYKKGWGPYAATVSGSITEGSQFTGTFTGPKAGNGTFTLTYAIANKETAAISRITKTYTDSNINFSSGISFSIDASGNLHPVAAGNNNESLFNLCTVIAGANSKITPVNASNIYSVSVELGGPCKLNPVDGVYTGLAATKITTNADDTLVLIVTDVTYGLAGDFGP